MRSLSLCLISTPFPARAVSVCVSGRFSSEFGSAACVALHHALN